jgi:adenylosuccinate lyase
VIFAIILDSTLLLCFNDLETIHKLQNQNNSILGTNIEYNDHARQVDDYSSYYELLSEYELILAQIKSFCNTLWLNISRGNLIQFTKKGECGSSVMPHKINPWPLEQIFAVVTEALGSLSAVKDIFMSLYDSRDMRDSVNFRFGNCNIGKLVLVIKQLTNFLPNVGPNREFNKEEINNSITSKGEILQTYLRLANYQGDAYKVTSDFTKGKDITEQQFNDFVDSFDILSPTVKENIKKY